MGAWSERIFGNDSAYDFANDLEQCSDLSEIDIALNDVLSVGTEYLDNDVASAGLAACDVIACLKGQWGQQEEYPETICKWIKSHPELSNTAPVEKALAVIDRVLTEPSELKGLWEDGNSYEAWLAAVTELRSRLNKC